MFRIEQAEEVLRRALARGADFAELYVEDGFKNLLRLAEDKVETVSTERSCGAGVRVFFGTLTAYAYTSGWDREDLLRIADDAATALALQVTDGRSMEARTALASWRAPVGPCGDDFAALAQLWSDPFAKASMQDRLDLLKLSVRAAHAEDQKISHVDAMFLDDDRVVQVFTSEGVHSHDRRSRGRFFITPIARATDGRIYSARCADGITGDFSYFRNKDWEAEAREVARRAVTMLEAPECPAGKLPVVIDPYFGGVIFHEACGHSLESSSVARNNSVFSGKLGQQIASTCVSAVDDGTVPGMWGTQATDDEGLPTQRNLLIENGILKGYLIDRLGSRLMGMEATGSGRRESYQVAPTSRMNNTFILAGTDDDEAMIRELPEGLYAKSLGGGSVNPLTGEFNFAVEEGYWIRNGEILTPVRGATLIGTGADVLMKIDRVGPNLGLASGMCGASSGSIPVTVGQPRIRVSELIIGGSGGAL